MLGTILILLCASAVLGPHGPDDLLALRRERSVLQAQRDRLAADNAALETNIQNIRSDKRAIEHLIRRELGWARPDELIYKFTADRNFSSP